MPGNPLHVALEPAAQQFVEASSVPPFPYQLAPDEGRKGLDAAQETWIFKPEIDEEWLEIEGGPTGRVWLRIVKPPGADEPLPVIVYVHGAGWVFGDAHTHDRLVRDLAVGVSAAVVFPEYDRSPEVGYPVAVEQCYRAAQWVSTDGATKGLDAGTMAVCGDSVGGNMSIAVSLLAKQRGYLRFVKQVLFYPVTNAAFDTESYERVRRGVRAHPPGHEVVLEPVHQERARTCRKHCLAVAGQHRGAVRAAVDADHHRRERRAA